MPDAYVEFSDQSRGYGFSYTLALGTEPGVARITLPPGQRLAPIDILNLYFRNARFLRLFDAHIVNPSSPSSTTQAPVEEITVEDRRWKWRYGETLDGDYNREEADGTLLRERSPRELAAICFEALGDQGANVAQLPADPRPRKIWRAADAKGELDRLCAEFGCAPAFNPFDNKAYIVKLGKGTAPPNRAHKSRTDATVSPTRPDAIRLIGGNTLYQSALALGEWLALEVDGSFVPMDSVSYMPAGGWTKCFALNFANLNTTYTDPATGETLYHRELAQRSIYRCCRISGQASGGFSPAALIGEWNEPQAVTDLGPFTGTRLEKDPTTGERMPVYVRGVFADPNRYGMVNTPVKTRYPGSVSINDALRIVTFSEPAFKLDADQLPTPCDDLELIAAYEVQSEGVAARHEQVRQAQGKLWGAGEERIHRQEIVREIIEADASATGKKVDNLTAIKEQAKYYIDDAASRYVDSPAANVVYSGAWQHVCDGKLRSVTWQFSTHSAPETACSWNCESHRSIRPYEERREARTQRQIDAADRRTAAEARIRASRAGALGAAGLSVAMNI